MFKTRFVSALLAVACMIALSAGAGAAEVECDAEYCFSAADFAQPEEEQTLKGICVTGLPDAATGTVMLGTRVLREGDILTAEQLEQLTFRPVRTETDRQAVMTFLPIYENRVAPAENLTISVWGKEDKAPVAEDFTLETYKNLPITGSLKVTDPEGQQLTFTVTRQPRRGELTVNADGTFVYTPKKNKVGTDSFTITATDPAGNVSREATVTIQILKPSDSSLYADTAGHSCRFAAEWMKNTGLFVAETVSGEACFFPDKTVTQGEFLSMVIKMLGIPTDETVWSSVPEGTPGWLRPYLAAAIRSGLTAGLPEEFDANAPITGAAAAVMLQNALDLTVSADADALPGEEIPAWAVSAMTVMAENGVSLSAGNMTRGEAAMALYRISQLAEDAPGMTVLRMQQ